MCSKKLSDKTSTLFADIFELDRAPSLMLPEVTAIVLCHNEALRLQHFLDYHRSIGIGHFLVVDNASTDGSAEILDQAPDVTRFTSQRLYSECKSSWREVLSDIYLVGKWVAFLDVDELLIHPKWPQHSLPKYTEILDRSGYDCLLSIMVDMYPDEVAGNVPYRQGTPFLDHSPFFDTGNYRLDFYKARQVEHGYPTPVVRLRGGARERLFHQHTIHHGTPVEKWLCRKVFSLSRSFRPTTFRRVIDALARKFTERMDSGAGLPNMGKVPLMRWREGCKFSSGIHRINTPMKVAPDLGALLHFKYLGDFSERITYNAARGQHTKGSAHYKQYSDVIETQGEPRFRFDGTRKFTGIDSLKSAQLIRSVL